jgi:predicted Rossmann-fold nucleotide-binding protein
MTTPTQKTNFEDLEKAFADYSNKAGSPAYIACFGKTFLEPDSEAYKLSEKVGAMIIENGFGVLHGGYIGSMEAVSNGANTAIHKDASKNEFWNIGIPMQIFDGNVARASSAHLPPANDIFDRKKALISFCDVCVVLPSGGVGTLLETLEILHVNQIAEKFGGKIRPLFFVGIVWKDLFGKIYASLDMTKQSKGESYLYFLESIEDLDKELKLLKTKNI